ncbi:exopolysaccharide biosynthesis polyprenyl glycosylphosphotransferase [Verrucomicrobium sp. GAS474]|uniref:sugar transferase n=1 Tax=Verrucomicrobium sp. GAS474 TaxID=1882831 RepID=UPI00087B35A9|nr:sugar transferase [Verrucomicrobium sp. GAS474]SDU14396.1 exopolysaccharide biosynthesis polyprenyl glycosylphosphotransferase [Verrucomicrobium sp. GAS474]
MLHRREQFTYQVLQIVDAFLLGGALCLAYLLRIEVIPLFPLPLVAEEIGSLGDYIWLFGIILPMGPLLLEFQGFYRLDSSYRRWTVLGRICRGVFYLWLLILAVIVFLRIPNAEVSRGVLLCFIPTGIAVIALREKLFRRWLHRRGEVAQNVQHVMLCGSLEQRKRWRWSMDAVVDRRMVVRAEVDLRVDSAERFLTLLHDESIAIVVFEIDPDLHEKTSQAIRACENEGIEAWVAADFIATTLALPKFDQFLGRPLLVFRTAPEAFWPLLCKAAIDRVGAFLLLVLSSPLLLAIGLAIRCGEGAPVFFSQMRSGRHGKPFRMYKFRTMVTTAEQKKDELRAFNEMSGPVFKMENDPRVTPLGRWLRRTSLDELPQLWNVVSGEMSLVGPRPLPVTETERFVDFAQRRRLSMKPGLTCLWQISGRNSISDFSDWVRLDLEYIDTWSLWNDFRILARTVPVVFFGKGAR